VVWRGEKQHNRTDAAKYFLEVFDRPIWAFVDFDPAGLVIALGLPKLCSVLAPSEQILTEMLQRGLEDRYRAQLPGSEATLDRCERADILFLWRLIRSAGRVLPQEALLTE